MRLNHCILTVLAAWAGIPPLRGQTSVTGPTNETRVLSMRDCLEIALERNLDLQIQRFNPKIAYYALAGSYGAWDPVFSANGTHFYSVQGVGVTSQDIHYPASVIEGNIFNAGVSGLAPSGLTYNISSTLDEQYGSFPKTSAGSFGAASLSQPLLRNLWMDASRLTIEINKIQIKSNELGLRQQIITTVTAVKAAYFDLIADRENIKVNEEAVRLARQLFDNNNRQVELGSMAPLDAKQAESQLAQTKAALLVARQALEIQENLLKSLLTDHFSSWAFVTILPSERLLALPESPDLKESWRAGLARRPDLLQTKLSLQRLGVQLKFDKNQLFPDLEMAGAYQFNGTSTKNPATGAGGQFSDVFKDFSSGDRPSYNFGGSLTLPVANLAARNQLRLDQMSRAQLALQFKKLEEAAMTAIADDVKGIESAFGQVEATRRAREFAEEALDAEQRKYKLGSSTVFVVLQLQSNLTSSRFTEIQALDNYNKALEQLAADTGTTLERNRIDLVSK